MPSKEVPCPPNTHHGIGKSQNDSENIPLFLKKYAGDPAIKVLIPVYNPEEETNSFNCDRTLFPG